MLRDMTLQLVSFYANQDPSMEDHTEAQRCMDAEGNLAWGRRIYEGIKEDDLRLQSLLIGRQDVDYDAIEEGIIGCYLMFRRGFNKYFAAAKFFVDRGYDIRGYDESRSIVAEVDNIIGNTGLMNSLPPAEEVFAGASADNPQPDRYTD